MTGARKQTKLMVEAVTNVAVGYILALIVQMAIFPFFELFPSLGEKHLAIGGIFTIVSLLRSFALRRIFEAHRKPS